MNRATLLKRLRALGACGEAVAWLVSTDHATLQSAWDACERPDWMLWLLHKLGADRKLMVSLACDCAETALPIWLRKYPDDDRPANAIRVARLWVGGEATIEQVREARRAAYAYADAAAYADADAAAYAYAAAAAAAAADADADAYAYADAARLKANKHMAALIRKRVPDPEKAAK